MFLPSLHSTYCGQQIEPGSLWIYLLHEMAGFVLVFGFSCVYSGCVVLITCYIANTEQICWHVTR